MGKRIISFSIALCMTIVLFTGMPIRILAAVSESDFTFSGGAITKYTGADLDVVIPDTIGGERVTSINALTFLGSTNLTSITIPEGVTYIGNQAFGGCTGLTSITIPDSLTSIGIGVFERCTSLTSITIPEGVTSITQYAFNGCTGLTSITIPDSVNYIGHYVFNGCSSLTSITIPEGVTSIGSYVFDGCTSLETIILPKDLGVRNANIPGTATKVLYEVRNGKRNVTIIALGSGKTSVTITDDMNISFVAKAQRSKVSKTGHTHTGGTATCIQKAKCDICDAEYGNFAEDTHTLTAHPAIAASCTTDGNEAYWMCSDCSKMFSDENGTLEIARILVIPAGHKYPEEWKSDDNGHWHECTACYDKKDVDRHSWNNGTVTTEPTEEAEGVRTYACTICSATKTESIPKLTHTHTYSNEWTSDSMSHWHAATCVHTGELSGQEAHTEDSGTVTIPATAETEGVKTFTCSVCGYVMRTESIPRLDEEHTHRYSPDADTTSNEGTEQPSTPPTGDKTSVSPSVCSVMPTVTETPAESDKNIYHSLIVILAAIAGISIIAVKKHTCKKNI